MPLSRPRWFSISRPSSNVLECAKCAQRIDLGFPSLDHHAAACPACGVTCVFLSWNGVLLQIIPEAAPPELARTLQWTQENLDELEFVTLLSRLEEINGAAGQAVERDGSGILKG